MIYLDYAANTPVDERVLDRFNEVTLKYSGNPNSLHTEGLNAKKEIDEASEYISNVFNTDKENIIYTSGSSESNNLVIKGIALMNKGKHIIISEVEHSSVVAPCNFLTNFGYDISVIHLDKTGHVDLEELEKSIRPDTVLISITSVDSELGTIQPIKEIVKIAKKHKVLFHTDATQAIGKTNIDFNGVDFLTFAPHKFFGLNGMSVLINFNKTKLIPLIHGGKSTTIFRSGTPVTANAVATSYALELATNNLEDKLKYIQELKDYLISNLSDIKNIHFNSPKDSIPSTLNFSVPNASKIVEELYKRNICISTKSACSSQDIPSKSVYAITSNEEYAKNSIRVSFASITTKEEIEEFIKIFKEVYYENN